MARGETYGDRGAGGAWGEPVADLAIAPSFLVAQRLAG
jgi:hypothetical protein